MQAAGRIYAPWALHGVGVSQSDIGAFMVGEIQIIASQRVGNPFGNLDEGRSLNVPANRAM